MRVGSGERRRGHQTGRAAGSHTFGFGVDIDVGYGGGVGFGADTTYVATKLGGLLAFLCAYSCV